jgi:hypothetical protein
MGGILNHVWIAFIAVTLLYALAWWRAARVRIAQNPELRQGYKRLIRGFIFWGNIPWLVMGSGVLVGAVESPQDYLEGWEANPWVLAWHVTVIGIWMLLLWWLFRRKGAEALVAHPGLFRAGLTKPGHIRLLVLALGLSAAAGMGMAFSHGMLIPYFTTQADGYTTVFIVYDGFWRVGAMAVLSLGVGTGALCGAIVWIRRLNLPKWWNRKEAGGASFLLVWSILWLVPASAGFSLKLWQAFELVRAYKGGTAQMAEGTARVRRLQPRGGHAAGDLIEISGAQVVVDFFQTTPAYKQTIARGGALQEGTQARVWHYEGKVLRLDVMMR